MSHGNQASEYLKRYEIANLKFCYGLNIKTLIIFFLNTQAQLSKSV